MNHTAKIRKFFWKLLSRTLKQKYTIKKKFQKTTGLDCDFVSSPGHFEPMSIKTLEN